MAEPVLLNFEKHSNLRLSETRDFTQFKSQHLVPVVFHEFYMLATEFPLVFVRNSESGGFVPVAMMGLSKGTNLYCQTPVWSSAFIPTSFSLSPLSVHRLEPGSDEAVIALDEESSLLSESVGEPMFEAGGEYTKYLQARIDHVVNITKQSLQTMALCKYLVEKNLFKSGRLSLQFSDKSPRYEVEGVYTIDEEALNKLSDEEYLELRTRGLLPLMYSHLTSLHKFPGLLRLQDQFDQEHAATNSKPDPEPIQ